jgi:hypothetical protein
MPRIRREFHEFVRLWNAHYIRKQKTREHVVPGKPKVLYEHPEETGAVDCKVPLDQDRWDTIQKVFLQDPMNLDEYLPQRMMDLCQQMIDAIGGLPNLQEEEFINTPWLKEYNYLREQLSLYEHDHPGSLLVLTSPTGSLHRVEEFFKEQGIDLNQLNQEDTIEIE